MSAFRGRAASTGIEKKLCTICKRMWCIYDVDFWCSSFGVKGEVSYPGDCAQLRISNIPVRYAWGLEKALSLGIHVMLDFVRILESNVCLHSLKLHLKPKLYSPVRHIHRQYANLPLGTDNKSPFSCVCKWRQMHKQTLPKSRYGRRFSKSRIIHK